MPWSSRSRFINTSSRVFSTPRLAVSLCPGVDYANAVAAYTALFCCYCVLPPSLSTPQSQYPTRRRSGDIEHNPLVQPQHLGKMSYMKKDEDADSVMIKLDRTSVFQDGRLPAMPLAMRLIRATSHCTLLTRPFVQLDSSIPPRSRRGHVVPS